MADSELGELRRAPRPIEARIARMGGWRSQGLAGGTSDTPYPLDYADGLTLLGSDGGDGAPSPEWFAESFTITSGSAATLSLTYVPVEYGEILRLNGVTLTRGTDYTIDGKVITWTTLAALILGIGGASWNLAATYPYYEGAGVASPTLSNVTIGTRVSAYNYELTLPSTPTATDVGLLVCPSHLTGITGGFTTWTKIYDGGAGAQYLAVWCGVGVGSGVISHDNPGTLTDDAALILATYGDVEGAVSVAYTRTVITDGRTTATAPSTAAEPGQIVITAVRGRRHGSLHYYSPDGTHSETGFTGTYARCGELTGTFPYAQGVAISAGLASATSVGGTFGMTAHAAADDIGEVATFVFSVSG